MKTVVVYKQVLVYFSLVRAVRLNTSFRMTSFTPTLDITASPPNPHRKPATFWLSFVAVTVCNVLSALDITAVATTLPTVTHDLNGGDKFVWVGAAYALAATAIAPLTGRLADSLGRRPTMLGCIAFFFVGSALSGSAQNMSWLIAARGWSIRLFF